MRLFRRATQTKGSGNGKMFYQPKNGDHGLPKNPFNSLVIPRPIGWITSLDADGVINLAPYSFFNAVCYRPPTVMFAAGAGPGTEAGGDWSKDSRRNIEATGEFVCNLTTWDTREQMNQTSATVARDVDEMALAGLTPEASELVKPPRVAEAPVHFECRHVRSLEIPHWDEPDQYYVVFGEVVGVHIRDDLITEDGLIDVAKMRPIGRLGYNDYTVVNPDTIFTMIRPD